ncbi:4Fe-4S binding protein [Desulfosporosinus hippei]|uniref:4Fe-4S binding domain-containing protein n=1 Tax=Desulfosporosinus hippei DSM 8344 TaxID=1121419 RepID=A0A1G8KBD8_9FIRM|nr:4Fe-4S binding protein [Desulfosporosinus hippei]SDI40748.1 4Fe-4S binding domain-containing protein [Desulfosporosinus hippei DSM 8344]
MKFNIHRNISVRNVVQFLFAAIVLYIGVVFVIFTEQLANNSALTVSRPAGVDGFLPISALVGLKAWVATGRFDPIHPAGLVIFLAAITLSVLVKRSFCAWICPIGTLSEGLAKIGKQIFGRNFQIPNWLDLCLRSLKYILLSIFIAGILFMMSGSEAISFMYTPYNILADVKMLSFFRNLGIVGMSVIGLIVLLSIFFENFWCRYLCPYGGLLGLFSLLSPFKITRNRESCVHCGKCNASCPNRVLVEKAERVWSPECTGCLNCVQKCPVNDTLKFQAVKGRSFLSPQNLAVGVLALWFLIIALAIVTGHWESKISITVYQELFTTMN